MARETIFQAHKCLQKTGEAPTTTLFWNNLPRHDMVLQMRDSMGWGILTPLQLSVPFVQEDPGFEMLVSNGDKIVCGVTDLVKNTAAIFDLEDPGRCICREESELAQSIN